MTNDYNIQVTEAIRSGEHARESLVNALETLEGAQLWGMCDMFGGGLLTTFMKQAQMEQASEYIEEAKADIMNFSRELRDVRGFEEINLDTGDFWGFADWFFDSILVDWVMQDRIYEAHNQVERAIQQVDYVLGRLKECG